jgi:ubiquinone/menaquinone biosynthesis C-methylase UbiE
VDSGVALTDALDRMRPLLLPEARAVLDAEDAPEGFLDLLGGARPESSGPAHDLMFTSLLPKVYEKWWRPAWGRMLKGVFGPGMDEERRIARLLMALSPGDGVLDVACGPGNFTRDFARAVGPEGLAVGLDASETMLRRAVADTRRARLDQVAYVRGDVIEMPFRPKSFDAVCCFAALNLFADPMAALDSMTRVLTPGGRIALFTSARTRSAPFRAFEEVVRVRSGMHLFERHELVEALEQRGYVEIEQRVTGFTQFVGGRLDG